MKFSQLKKLGFKSGQQDVRGFYQDNGSEEFLQASNSVYGWDESAINAGVLQIVSGLSRASDGQHRAFYDAYNLGAAQEQQEILKEISEEQTEDQAA